MYIDIYRYRYTYITSKGVHAHLSTGLMTLHHASQRLKMQHRRHSFVANSRPIVMDTHTHTQRDGSRTPFGRIL